MRQIKDECEICQKDALRSIPKTVTGELARGTLPAQIWQIHYLGPLPVSRGCRFICTCVDTYSGILVACACQRTTQKNTCKTLAIITLYCGSSLQIQSDNGFYFKGKEIETYCQQHNLEWVYQISYYPQAVGLIERMNGLLKERLRKLGNNSYKNRKDHLFLALQQLNNRPLGNSTPLARMMIPSLQIRSQQSPTTLQWWAIDPTAQAPYMGTLGSAGSDLHTLQEIWIDPNTTHTIPTGLGIQTPKGHFGHIRPRSSLALKGLQIMAAVIDSDHMGEMKVLPPDVSSQPVQLQAQEQVAHVVVISYRKGEWHQLPQVPGATTRVGGFGSTSMKPGAKVWVRDIPTTGPGPQRLLLKELTTP